MLHFSLFCAIMLALDIQAGCKAGNPDTDQNIKYKRSPDSLTGGCAR